MPRFSASTIAHPDPLQFGRRQPFAMASTGSPVGANWGDDLRLFAATFVSGFIIVSALIA
jgi:hypothetical protein